MRMEMMVESVMEMFLMLSGVKILLVIIMFISLIHKHNKYVQC